jgi:hypothetical protein
VQVDARRLHDLADGMPEVEFNSAILYHELYHELGNPLWLRGLSTAGPPLQVRIPPSSTTGIMP